MIKSQTHQGQPPPLACTKAASSGWGPPVSGMGAPPIGGGGPIGAPGSVQSPAPAISQPPAGPPPGPAPAPPGATSGAAPGGIRAISGIVGASGACGIDGAPATGIAIMGGAVDGLTPGGSPACVVMGARATTNWRAPIGISGLVGN